MKSIVTLRVDADLLREGKVLAARQGSSVSRLMTEQIEELVRKDQEYERAQRRALGLDKGFDFRWSPPASRDELHER